MFEPGDSQFDSEGHRRVSCSGQAEILLRAPEWETARDSSLVGRAVTAVLAALDYGHRGAKDRVLRLEVRRGGLAVILDLAVPGGRDTAMEAGSVEDTAARAKRAFLSALAEPGDRVASPSTEATAR